MYAYVVGPDKPGAADWFGGAGPEVPNVRTCPSV